MNMKNQTKNKILDRKIYKILQRTNKGYKVIYIGQTHFSLYERFVEHCQAWLGKLVQVVGLKNIRIVCIQHCMGTFNDASKIEIKYINAYKKIFNLYNNIPYEEKRYLILMEILKIQNKINFHNFIHEIKNNDLMIKWKFDSIRKLSTSTSQPMYCVTTNKIFSCCQDAKNFYNLTHLRTYHKYYGNLPDGTPIKWQTVTKSQCIKIINTIVPQYNFLWNNSKTYKIYKILQRTNRGYKVIYIGQTTFELNKRFWDHCETWLKPLIFKYDVTNFKIVCICHCKTQSECNKKEKQLIKLYSKKFKLYNTFHIYKAPKPQKIKKPKKIVYKQLSLFHNLTEQHKLAIGKSNGIKVKCTTTGESFYSLKEARRKYAKYKVGRIKKCCDGKQKFSGKLPDGTKLQWEYDNE